MKVATLPLAPPLDARRFALDCDGAPLVAYAAGPDAPAPGDPAPVPLLLIHSINAAASAYEIKPLFDHYRATRPVYALDLPGYGLSDRADRFYSLRLMTDAVLRLTGAVSALHGDVAVDAIAVSLSSEYLARAAVERPAAYRSVALVSATGLTRKGGFRAPPGTSRGKSWLLQALGRAPWSAWLFRTLTRPPVIRYFLQKTWGSKHIDEGLMAYDVQTTRQPGASNAPFHFLSAYLFAADITDVYERIEAPVLLVHGTRGDFVRYPDAERLAGLRGWTVQVMQTGAMPYFEDLRGFVDGYERFVRQRVGADAEK